EGLCCRVLYQIVTEQQLAQKLQIVTAIDQAGAGKQQFILANLDYPNQEKLFIKQENSPTKVILTSADGSAVNQLLFTSPELTGQQIQFVTEGSEQGTTKPPVEYCVVCGDKASGRHYGAVSCEGCKGFFKRSIRKNLVYTCRGSGECVINKHHRNRCQYCRLQRCMALGMKQDCVEREASKLCPSRRHANVCKSTSLLDSNMLLNIQQSLSKLDNTILIPSSPDQNDSSQGDLGTLANVVTSLGHLSKSREMMDSSTDLSGIETMSNEDSVMMDIQREESNDVTRAFDTLTKVLQSEGGCGEEVAEGAVRVDEQTTALLELEGPLLSDMHVPFKLMMPLPMPDFLNLNYICESASRLLFLSMHWARSIPAFQALGSENSITLMKACWNELFALGLAQCSHIMNVETILTAIINHLQTSLDEEKLSPERVKLVMEHIWRMQEFCNSMSRMSPDAYEYAYLKAVVLFSPDHSGVDGTLQIERFQEKACMELQDYVSKVYPEDTYRLSKLLVRLPALRLMSAAVTEELFFTGLIGNVQIDSIIPYILKMESTDYNSQPISTAE
uniref:Nuclear receptor subfamily 2, group C, member 1 n=1 Tax=Cyprinus carpio TaxID=7962 RepID=A0A8C2BHN5_CYPCA